MTKNISTDGGVYDDTLQPAPPLWPLLTNAAELTGKTNAQTPISFTTLNDGQKHLYYIFVVVTVTAFTAGSFNPQATWTDDNGTARTAQAIPVGTAGAAPSVTAIGATGTFLGGMPVAVNPNTTLSVLTGGTFTTLTYNISAAVALLR